MDKEGNWALRCEHEGGDDVIPCSDNGRDEATNKDDEDLRGDGSLL